jgi:hypothetical protein
MNQDTYNPAEYEEYARKWVAEHGGAPAKFSDGPEACYNICRHDDIRKVIMAYYELNNYAKTEEKAYECLGYLLKVIQAVPMLEEEYAD